MADNKLMSKVQAAMGSFNPSGASNVEQQPKRDMSKNLGKYLHPKGGVRPASDANGTVDANAAGAKVRQTQ